MNLIESGPFSSQGWGIIFFKSREFSAQNLPPPCDFKAMVALKTDGTVAPWLPSMASWFFFGEFHGVSEKRVPNMP